MRHQTIRFVPEWAAYYDLVVRLDPGAFALGVGHGRVPMELFRCLVCFGLTDGRALEGHWRHHLRAGDVVR